MVEQTDILIIGGGLTGATLMRALQGLGYRVILVESKPFSERLNSGFDARSLALSPASKKILSQLGIWEVLKASATQIRTIHVSEQRRFGSALLDGTEHEPLGYVLEIHEINKALHQLLPKENLLAPATLTGIDMDQNQATISTPEGELTVKAQLIVAADGADSSVRQLIQLPSVSKNYQQTAIVANVGLAHDHMHRAYERFSAHGPLALLPMEGRRMSVVWAMQPLDAMRLMNCSDADFQKQLQKEFGYRLGRFVKIGTRHTYPLKQVLMPQQMKWPVLFVGNAAHTLHPVAGQGFNLGLRDVAMLAQCISKQGLSKDIGHEYLKLRQHDQKVIAQSTDGLVRVFANRLPGMGLLRSLGLVALDNIPAFKNVLAHYARGFGGVIPDLVCDIALNAQEKK